MEHLTQLYPIVLGNVAIYISTAEFGVQLITRRSIGNTIYRVWLLRRYLDIVAITIAIIIAIVVGELDYLNSYTFRAGLVIIFLILPLYAINISRVLATDNSRTTLQVS